MSTCLLVSVFGFIQHPRTKTRKPPGSSKLLTYRIYKSTHDKISSPRPISYKAAHAFLFSHIFGLIAPLCFLQPGSVASCARRTRLFPRRTSTCWLTGTTSAPRTLKRCLASLYNCTPPQLKTVSKVAAAGVFFVLPPAPPPSSPAPFSAPLPESWPGGSLISLS